jgi:hypothetical protein
MGMEGGRGGQREGEGEKVIEKRRGERERVVEGKRGG